MLKQRILTSLILMPVIIWAIFALENQIFTYAISAILFLATLEWNHFVDYTNKMTGWLFSLVTTAGFLYVSYIANSQVYQWVIYIALFWWLITLPLLRRFPFSSKHLLNNKAIKVVIGFVVLLATFTAINILRNNSEYGPEYVLYLLLIIWFADSGAYFTGRALGKHKLLPKVSPGKTWEGVAGGIAVTLVIAIIAVNILSVSSSSSILFILITLLSVIYSVIGDLTESMFKRMVNLKDSSHLLPGHGGILDRIDSLTAALPVFVAGLWLMEKLA
jgi:phosphatidate cytidylyltransferase